MRALLAALLLLPSLAIAQPLRIGDAHVGEEHFAEVRRARDLPDAAQLDARRTHVDEEESQPRVLGLVGIGARHQQTEVGEVSEPAGAGRGGSSTMPQKRNPALSAQILAASNLAPSLAASLLAGLVHEHERSTGGWQASWFALPQILLIASGAFERTAQIATGLEVDKERMRANLEISNGLIMAEAVQFALAAKLGKLQAHELVASASKQALSSKQHLKDALRALPEVLKILPGKKLDELFEPATYLGETQKFIDATIAAAERSLTK